MRASDEAAGRPKYRRPDHADQSPHPSPVAAIPGEGARRYAGAAIAHAIEVKNTRFLTGLKGIGKRGAELIVAELAGKLGAFAQAPAGGATSTAPSVRKLNTVEEDAVLTLVTLGERRPDAEALLEQAKAAGGTRTDQLVREMLRLRGTR